MSYSCDVVRALEAAILIGSYLLAFQDPPPSAPGQGAKPEFPSRDELKIVVIHDDQASCSDYPKTFRCPNVKHWVLSVNEVKCANQARVEAFIKSEAERRRTTDPKLPRFTDLQVKILAESGAPYSEAGSLLTKCAKMGIYKLELGEKKTEGHDGTIKAALGVGVGYIGDRPELVVLIGKQESQDKVRWVEAAGLKEAVDDAAKDLGPRDKLSVVLNPIPSTPWTEVIQLLAACKNMGFERTEFAADFKVSDVPKK